MDATFYECIGELLSFVFKNAFSKNCLQRLRSDRKLINAFGTMRAIWYVLKGLFAKKAPDGSNKTLIDSINAPESSSELFQCGFFITDSSCRT